jgi:hypothetical protein
LHKNLNSRIIWIEVKTRQAVKIACLLCAAMLPAVAQAQFTYTTNADGLTLTITGDTNIPANGAVNIPSTINGLPVTSIGSFAFSNNQIVNSVTISNGVTSIGVGAFGFCPNLNSVAVLNNSISIGDSAFAACGALNTVWLPNNVSFGYGVFGDSPSLTAVYFSGDAPSVVGADLFKYDNNVTVFYGPGTAGWGPMFANCPTAPWDPATGLVYITNADETITLTQYAGFGGELVIPGTIDGLTVISIGNSTFNGCGSLTSVTIPDTVTGIGDDAFYNCTGMTNVIIGDSVTNIGASAFSDCSSLTSVTIPASVTSIEYPAFDGCISLTSVSVDVLNPDYSSLAGVLFDKNQTTLIRFPAGEGGSYTIPDSVTNIAQTALENSSLTVVTIPDSVTSIGDSAFYNCLNLTNVIIGNAVTCIGNSTFAGDPLSSITIPDNVTSIGGSTFSGCTNLTNAILSDSLTGIGDDMFNGCSSLITLSIPDSVACIGDYALSGCSSLTNVIIGNGVTSIGIEAFCFDGSLTSLTIPDSVTSIGDWAFADCESLGSVIIGNGVTSCDYAFNNCSSLTNVIIGNGVTSIGYSTFAGDPLSSITIPDSVTIILDGAFSGCSDLTNVNFGNGVTSIGGEAFEYDPLISITIPQSVGSIGGSAFYDCDELASVYFAGNAPSVDPSVFGVNDDFPPYSPIATAYYLPGTTGWDTFDADSGLPSAVLWIPQIQTSGGSFGVQSNQFGFNISWASGQTVVVEACTNLSNPVWQPIQTNTLINGSFYFSDPQWTNYPERFYQLSSP